MPLKNKAISMHCLIFALNTQEGTSISSPALNRVLTRILKTGFIESIPGKSWSQN